MIVAATLVQWSMLAAEPLARLLEPLSYGFMVRGLAASVMVGVVCSVMGCYVVLRGMAFLGDAMAHAILPGVAVAYLLGGNFLLGAAVAAIAVALLIGLITRQGVVKEDTAIGILFAASLSLGVLLISTMRTYAVDLTHILFGNVLGVSVGDLWLIAGLGAVVLGAVLLLYKELLVVNFDPVLATTLRLPVERLRNLLLVLLALTVVASLPTVGVGLVAAMLVTPGATAYLITRRLSAMMVTAAGIGAGCSVVGLYLSYYWNVASGAAVVLTATAVFGVVYLVNPRAGILRSGVGPRLTLAGVAVLLTFAGCAPGLAPEDGNGPENAPTPISVAGTPLPEPAARATPLRIVAVETFLADMVRNVAADRATVTALLPFGVDPHAFEPTPADVRAVADADVLVINGAGLEAGFLAQLLESAGGGRPVIVASEGLPFRGPGAGEVGGSDGEAAVEPEAMAGADAAASHEVDSGDDDGGDPHFWLDPVLGMTYVDNIRAGLVAADPAGAAVYAAHAEAYRQQLADLDSAIRLRVGWIPEGQRLLVTDHDNLGYFADRYGFRIAGTVIPSHSTGAAPSARHLAALVDRIRATGARAIFLHGGANARLAEQVAGETGVQVVTGLHTHSITPPDGPAPTYLDMLRANAEAIVAALGVAN